MYEMCVYIKLLVKRIWIVLEKFTIRDDKLSIFNT